MSRGKYPLWRWQSGGTFKSESSVIQHRAHVWRHEGHAWNAIAYTSDDSLVSARFPRRCDAKRWCEWMLARGGP